MDRFGKKKTQEIWLKTPYFEVILEFTTKLEVVFRREGNGNSFKDPVCKISSLHVVWFDLQALPKLTKDV